MTAPFSSEDIDVVMALARELTGAKMTRRGHSVIIQNVASRMVAAGCDSLDQYLKHVDAHQEEMPFLLSALTIHTTAWFREAGAFSKVESILATTTSNRLAAQPFRILSIACSTGEEVYTLAAVMEHFRLLVPTFEYALEGWDIDPVSLRTARYGQYDLRQLEQVPVKYRQHLVRNSGLSAQKFEVDPNLRERCRFRTVNIMAPPSEHTSFDLIFCRNMLIYFERADVERIVAYMRSRLSPDGHVCVGVSETSAISSSGWLPAGDATYRQANSGLKRSATPKAAEVAVLPKAAPASRTILVVEDDVELRAVMIDSLTAEQYDVLPAANSIEAMALLKKHPIGLIFSDFRMAPGKSGVEFCREARDFGYRGPFVIISGYADMEMSQRSMASGCNEVILKPLSEVDLTRLAKIYLANTPRQKAMKPDLILLGASTGGTETLAKIVVDLPRNCPPVMIVQHITHGFSRDFAERLASLSGLRLGKMLRGEPILPGHLYMPLGDYHIGLRQSAMDLRLTISEAPLVSGHRPSVDHLFAAAAETNLKIFAALLTGMGRDGAEGLLALRNQGAETLAQNEQSSVVYGMPKEAVRLNAAIYIGDPTEIRRRLFERLEHGLSTRVA